MEDPPTRSPRVLVVDPDADRGGDLAARLAGRGYRTTAVLDGGAAVEAIQAAAADVVLVQQDLPDPGAYELATRLRASDGAVGALIVVITQRELTADLSRAHAAGIDAFLSHPVDIEDIADIVEWIGG